MSSSRDFFYAFDSPVPYKKLEIHPVRMKHYIIFNGVAPCLLLEKNSITDPIIAVRAISMSYLEYLFFVANDSNQLIYLLDGLLRLVLNKIDDDEFRIRYPVVKGKRVIVINDEIYGSSDFDNLREIIAEQNMLDLPNEKIQKDVRNKLEEARRFKDKLNKTSVASLEEQMMAIALYSGWELDYVYELTIRKFIMSVRRANHMIMSNIYLNASMSGFVKFKDKSILQGWLTDLEVADKYADVKMSPDALASKANFEEAKK